MGNLITMTLALTTTTILGVTMEWTVLNYYIFSCIIHAVLIPVGFRVMQVDPEHNSFIGGLIVAVIINVAAYFVRDAGVFGVLIVGGVTFGLLAAVTSGEVLKALLMSGLVVGTWGALGHVLIPKTPLEVDDVAGFTRVLVNGGLEPEPITEDDTDKLTDPDSYISE